MRIRPSFLFANFLAAVVSAHGATIVFDNFSCPDSVSQTGPGFNASFTTCAGSIGGFREDFLDIPSGPSTSVSTMNSDPPAGAITGTFGPGISEYAGMDWGNKPGGFVNLGLDLVGDSILVQIQSDSAGTFSIFLSTTVIPNEFNGSEFSASFAGSPSVQDVLIPLTGTPVVSGTAANLADVNDIDLAWSLDTAGATWTIDAVEAVPEPSTLLLVTIGLLLAVLLRSRRGRVLSKL